MNTKQMIETFRTKAASDKAFNDTMHMFATRKRARYIITVSSLAVRMKAEGFDHSLDEYAKVLAFLGEHGVGKVVHDSKGRVIGLKEIRVRLQTLGLSVIHKSDTVFPFTPRNKFHSVPAPTSESQRRPEHEVKPLRTNIKQAVVLTFVINGKPINLSIPPELDPNDIGDLVKRLEERSA